MKQRWLLVLGLVVALVACTPDTTLETLVPRSSLAVLWIERPQLLPASWGLPLGELPRQLLGQGPWAATVHSGSIPGFRLYVSLKDEASWPLLEEWASQRGGLEAVKVGTYAVLSSPGLPAVAPLSPEQRYDPRQGTGLVRLSLDASVVEAWVDRAGWRGLPLPWAQFRQEVSGVHFGLDAKEGGLELVVTPLFRQGAWKAWLEGLKVPPALGQWGPRPLGEGVALGFLLPGEVKTALGALRADPGWKARWSALAPLVGPRGTIVAQPRADGSWSWAGALESSDPQAVRQALKALVAGGDFQAVFPSVAEDNDTPVIYQDRSDGLGEVVTTLVVGPQRWLVGYGTDRVVFAGGAGAEAALRAWRRALPEAPGTQGDPWVEASGRLDGLAARATLSLPRGQLELRVKIAAPDVAGWTERLPQAFVQWLSSEGGWTVFEP